MTEDLDERWEDGLRERTTEVSNARCKLRYELLEDLRLMSPDQRKRRLPIAAEFASLFDDVDEATFRKMLRVWMSDDSSEFRRTTLESLGFDPEVWKRREES